MISCPLCVCAFEVKYVHDVKALGGKRHLLVLCKVKLVGTSIKRERGEWGWKNNG